MTILTFNRHDWGADPDLPRMGYEVPDRQFWGLVLHHTAGVMVDFDHDSITAGDIDDVWWYMRRLQRMRPDLGLDIPYSWVVFEGAGPNDAIICEGRGRNRTGAHTAGYNSTHWGVALAGDYTDIAPTPGMLAAVRQIGRWLPDPAGARPTLGHRDTVATACPGQSAYPHVVDLQPPYTDPDPDQGDDEMPSLIQPPALNDDGTPNPRAAEVWIAHGLFRAPVPTLELLNTYRFIGIPGPHRLTREWFDNLIDVSGL